MALRALDRLDSDNDADMTSALYSEIDSTFFLYVENISLANLGLVTFFILFTRTIFVRFGPSRHDLFMLS